MINKGAWVEIVQSVLESEERAANIPKETRNTPLMLWAKGFLLESAHIGDTVSIKTVTGRVLEGILTEENPKFIHDFGDFVAEIMYIGPQAKEILWGENNE